MKLIGSDGRVPESRVGVHGDYFVHESSYVDDGATIGAGTKIWHFCHVMPGAVIGERCNLGQNVVVMGGTRLGNNVKVQNNVSIYEGVILEDDVFCGPELRLHQRRQPAQPRLPEGRVPARRWSGGAPRSGPTPPIVCGATLGEYCFIGAGAVVRGEVPAYRADGRRAGPAGRLDVPVRRPAVSWRADRPRAPPAARAIAKRTACCARLTHPSTRLSSTAAEGSALTAPLARPVRPLHGRFSHGRYR